MKPDQAAIDKAIADDIVIQSIDKAKADHIATERTRVANVRLKADELWSQAGELRRQAHNLQQKAAKLSRRLAIRRGPTDKLNARRRKRSKYIIAQLENEFVKEQRLAFRRAHKLT